MNSTVCFKYCALINALINLTEQQQQACSETLQRLHSPGNWAMFPEITTFSFKYVSFLAFSLAFGLKSAINYKSNIAELPASKNQKFSN